MGDAAIYMTGVIVWILLGISAFGWALIEVCKLINKAVWKVLDCYGGIETFREYRHWYQNTRNVWKDSHD